MKILKSILIASVSLLVFFFFTGLIEFVFNFLDRITGNNFLLQEIWSSVLAAGIAGYLSVKIIRQFFHNFHKQTFFLTYVVSFFIFTVGSLYLMISVAGEAWFGIKEFSIQILTPICAIASVYMALEGYTDESKAIDVHDFTDSDFE